MKHLSVLAMLLLASFGLSGCMFAAGAGAGAVVTDEANENDGEFDPLEETRENIGEEAEEVKDSF